MALQLLHADFLLSLFDLVWLFQFWRRLFRYMYNLVNASRPSPKVGSDAPPQARSALLRCIAWTSERKAT